MLRYIPNLGEFGTWVEQYFRKEDVGVMSSIGNRES
jgi:hypothetical protein